MKPVGHSKKLEVSDLTHIKEFLGETIVGQEQTVNRIAEIANQIELGIRGSTKGPIARWIEVGPSGVGKTEVVLQLIRYFHDRYKSIQREEIKNTEPENLLMKVNCAELQHSHEIAKLIGSPPGYIGHRETEPVFSAESISAHSLEFPDGRKVFFVLFDEIEKGSEALYKLLLSPLDKGDMKLGDNTKVDFTNAVVIFTSNLGNKQVSKAASSIGFIPPILDKRKQGIARVKAVKDSFSTEMLGRLGGEKNIILFQELSEAHLLRILEINLRRIEYSFACNGANIKLSLSGGAEKWFLKHGTSPDTGARELESLTDREIVGELAKASVNHKTKYPDPHLLNGKKLLIDVENDQIIILDKT